eukprot:5782792-Alexandrium_andersonii.AAC.1
MSASLVGSEMCIRDRPCLNTGNSFALSELELGETDTASNRVPIEPRSAVSYTHLTLPTICSV